MVYIHVLLNPKKAAVKRVLKNIKITISNYNPIDDDAGLVSQIIIIAIYKVCFRYMRDSTYCNGEPVIQIPRRDE